MMDCCIIYVGACDYICQWGQHGIIQNIIYNIYDDGGADLSVHSVLAGFSTFKVGNALWDRDGIKNGANILVYVA